jgi:hypothetical protein
MVTNIKDFVSGGYIITQFADGSSRNQWMRDLGLVNEDLLPEKILGISLCLEPEAPLLRWHGGLEEDFASFGIPTHHVEQLYTWADEKYKNKDVGWPNIFLELPTAREYVLRFTTNDNNDIQILGIALPKHLLHRIDEIERLFPTFANTGFDETLRRGKQPASGEILGFDVICCNESINHSWTCTPLPAEGLRDFNFRPNQFSLIDEEINAVKLADYDSDAVAKNGMWLPVLVTRYPLTLDAKNTATML